jgi:uncharacterized protein (TIGR00369 family)
VVLWPADNLRGVDQSDGERVVGYTPLQRMFGINFVGLFEGSPDGAATVEIADIENLKGPAGSLEGGVVATLLDYAGAIAAARALNGLVATQSLSICYLHPVKVGPAVAVGTPLRSGNREAVVEVKVFDAGRDDRLCATALLTAVRIGDKPVVDGS